MIEIKFNKKKKKKGSKNVKQILNPLTQKIETSKKLAWFSGVCFAIAIIYSMLIFAYGVITNTSCDLMVLATLITVPGSVFGVTMVAYMNKGRYENIIKIQMSLLRERYAILQDMGVLDNSRGIQEIEDDFTDIENDFDNEKSIANQEITYNS